MIIEVASYTIFGMPLVAYAGIITLLSFLFTAAISILNKIGFNTIPFKWHPRMAIISIIFAFVHAILGLAVVIGF